MKRKTAAPGHIPESQTFEKAKKCSDVKEPGLWSTTDLGDNLNSISLNFVALSFHLSDSHAPHLWNRDNSTVS